MHVLNRESHCRFPKAVTVFAIVAAFATGWQAADALR
jgi:hypothetical protein